MPEDATLSKAHEETVEQLSRLYDEHQRRTSRVQRMANRITASLGRPAALIVVVLVMLLWVAGNQIARIAGYTAIEQLPFPNLEFVATLAALIVALLILTTQRHEDQLAETRARLTLQIAVLSEKKIAKIIELLEEQRHDNPLLPERDDGTARDMATPVNAVEPGQSLSADEG